MHHRLEKTKQYRLKTSSVSQWFWICIAVEIVAVVGTWNFRADRAYEPLHLIALMVLVLTSVVAAYVTMRFTRRLERLRRRVEQINLRDLAAHVPIEGTDALAALAQSFNQMVDRLASQEQVRRQFFADLTHEIRHPIAILMGRLESIQDGVLPLDGEQVLMLHDTVIDLKHLVNDMHDLALADVGQLSLHLTQINVGDIVEQLQADLEPVADSLGIKLSSSVRTDMPHIYADIDRVRQVLVNLMTNALHHTPKGGQVELSAEYDDNYAVISVDDNGTGIDSSDIPHLFERFYRADKSRSRTKTGSGLGLSIVGSIVKLHGGTVKVESSLGKGSKFIVCFPLSGSTINVK